MLEDYQMQGWMFVNFFAFVLHYRIYNLLKKYDLLKRYSPEDVIEHLEHVNMLKIWDEWKLSKLPKKSRHTVESLEIPIVQMGRSWRSMTGSA